MKKQNFPLTAAHDWVVLRSPYLHESLHSKIILCGPSSDQMLSNSLRPQHRLLVQQANRVAGIKLNIYFRIHQVLVYHMGVAAL